MKRTEMIMKLREMRVNEKLIGKLSWKFMSDDERMDALLSTVKDPDEAEQYIDSEWNDLPPAVTQNMRLESINEVRKPVQKKDWDKADDDQKEEWLSQAFSDPDDAAEYIESKWEDLPPAATQNMKMEGASVTMGGTRVAEAMKINKNARRKVRPHGNVSAGSVAIRFDDKPFTVVGVGTVAELEEFDLDGAVKELDLDPDDEAIAVEDPNTGYAIYSYDLGGAVVYEGIEIDENKLSEAYKIGDEVILRGNSTVTDILKVVSMRKKSGSKMAYKVEFPNGEVAEYDETELSLNPGLKEATLNDTISMDRLKEIIKEEVMNETRNLDKMQAKLRTVDNAQDVLRTLRDIISDTNTFNGQQFTKLEDIYEEIRDLKNDAGVSIGDLVSPAILAAFKKDMAEVPTVLSMLSDLEGDRVSKYSEFGE
jgi:uncharacterized protein YbdZ (MbtH family)